LPPDRRSDRFVAREQRELRRELLIEPLAELGLVAMNGPNDPEPSLVVEGGHVVELDGRREEEWDALDHFIVRHGLDLDPLFAQVELQPHPHRDFRAGRRLALVRLVDGVDGRHPHGACTFARGDLDGKWVHPPDRAVERDRAKRLDPRHGLAHDGGALGGRRVVRLEDEPGHPELLEAPRERHVVDLALHDVGADVDVGVVGTLQELARALRWLIAHASALRSASATCERCVRIARSAASPSPSAIASTTAVCSANDRSLRPGSRIVRY